MIQFEPASKLTTLMAAYYFFMIDSSLVTWNVIQAESYLYFVGIGNVARFDSADRILCKKVAKKNFMKFLLEEANHNRKESELHFVLESQGTGSIEKILRMDEIDPNYINAEGDFLPCVDSLRVMNKETESFVLSKMIEASKFGGVLLQMSLK